VDSGQAPLVRAAATAEPQHCHRHSADGMDCEAQTRRPDHHYGYADHPLDCALVARACSEYSSPGVDLQPSRVAARLEATLFGYAYERVDALCATIEIQLYHYYFSIPKDRIRLSLSCMKPSKVEPGESLVTGDYMAAIGGNSRDYQLEDARDPDGLGDASREHGCAGSASPCPRFLQHVVPGGNELSGSLTRDGAVAEGGRGAMRSCHPGLGDVFGQGHSCNRLCGNP